MYEHVTEQDDMSLRENTGRWTPEEHRMFEEGLRKYGKQWKKIAATIPSRTVVQIRTHAQKYFLRLSKSGNAVSSSIAGKPKVTAGAGAALHKKVPCKRKVAALNASENVSPNGNSAKPSPTTSPVMIGKAKGLTKLTIPMAVRTQSDTGIPLLPPNTHYNAASLPQVVGDYANHANASPTSVTDLYPPFPTEPFKVHDGEGFNPLVDRWPYMYSQSHQPQPEVAQHQQHQPPSTAVQHQEPQPVTWPPVIKLEQQPAMGMASSYESYSEFESYTSFTAFPSAGSTTEEQPDEEFDESGDLGYSLMEQGPSDPLDSSAGYLSDQSVNYDETIGIWQDHDHDHDHHDHDHDIEEHPCKRVRSDESDSDMSGESSMLSICEEAAFDDMIDQLLEMNEADLEDVNRPLF